MRRWYIWYEHAGWREVDYARYEAARRYLTWVAEGKITTSLYRAVCYIDCAAEPIAA